MEEINPRAISQKVTIAPDTLRLRVPFAMSISGMQKIKLNFKNIKSQLATQHACIYLTNLGNERSNLMRSKFIFSLDQIHEIMKKLNFDLMKFDLLTLSRQFNFSVQIKIWLLFLLLRCGNINTHIYIRLERVNRSNVNYSNLYV